jgi:hypothetical protein
VTASGPAVADAAEPARGPAATSRPAAAGDDPVVAYVNGEAIPQAALTEMLMESRGLAILEQMILLTAARQKAAALGVVVKPEDIKAAEEEALRRIAAPVGNPDAASLDRVAAERLLAEFLRLKGLSEVEWKCRMEQRAYLTRIAQAQVAKTEITEQMLKDEYGLEYGERAQIRHIQASTADVVSRAVETLKTRPFEQVAREQSENAITREQGGLMPAFTRHDGSVPPLVREKAFSMKPGEVSEPLREGAWYHIIRLERVFPASGVGFENIDQDTLRKKLADRLVRKRVEELDGELFQAARITIRNAQLDKQFRERHRR